MTNSSYADYDHLREHAERLFPGASIEVNHTNDEVIHIDVNRHRFSFEITSDDEEYVFTDGQTTFTIPLMECPTTSGISPDARSEPILMGMSVPNQRR